MTIFGITLQNGGVSLEYFSENGEWDLLSTSYGRTEYEEDDYSYAKVSLYFNLERRPVYYGLNTILPVIVNSLLIPLVFLMPNESGEKIGFCLTSLLAYVVILTLVTQDLPTSAKTTSLLGSFLFHSAPSLTSDLASSYIKCWDLDVVMVDL